ncbi:MAG: serine hydroxymethyltransferase, partial [Flammeovirgaceae bacterium]|nr:serine hydroxymethyltransferase [Flammeovirgaceae bacterium]
PMVTSGIRIGTPAITTRGLKEKDMVRVVELIDRVLSNINNEDVIKEVKLEVNSWMRTFPLFNENW